MRADASSKTVNQPPSPRRNIVELAHPVDVRSRVLIAILILVSLAVLKAASAFFVPIVLALLLQAVFTPLVRGLSRLWIPRPVGAVIVLIAVLGSVSFAAYSLSGPAAVWMSKAPDSLGRVERQLRGVKKSVEDVGKTTAQVDKITTLGAEERTQKVEVKEPGIGKLVFSQTQGFLVAAGIMFGLLYFLLASGDLILRKLVNVLPRFEDKKRAVEISHQIEHDISRYLFTIAFINCVFGAAVGFGLFLIGLPNPELFGIMAAVLNFIPYLGAIAGMAIVTLAAALMTEEMTAILLAPGLYWGLNLCEEYILRPVVMSRRLTLNPVVIFIWLIFWGWMWGIAGALMAVPMLAVFKIICEHLEPLTPIGEFLNR